MKGMKLDHISYAVRSTDEAIKTFNLFYSKIDTFRHFEKNQNVFITYLSDDSANHRIELVEPAGSPNPVQNMLKSMPSVLYHVCYRVEDFSESVKSLKESGFYMVSEPSETSIEKGIWASHFFNSHCGIIEIMGRKFG
jgi:methylmalonyl-CoA/ethylmalonyl-CoA epimerase